MPTPVNQNDEMNLATMTRTMFRGLGLDELSGTELTRTRVFRQFNAQSGEYDYAVTRPNRRTRIVTTREIVDASELRQQAQAERQRQMENESMRRMTVRMTPPPSGIRELRIEPRQGYSFQIDAPDTAAQMRAEGERIRQDAMQRIREQEAMNALSNPFQGWAIQANPDNLPPVPRSAPRYPSPRFFTGTDFTEAEVRSHISAMNNEIYSLLASDHKIAALVAKPPLIHSIKHHLRHEVFVRMEPMRIGFRGDGEMVNTAPATPTQQVISSGPDMLLGYRLVADDAADPYWIVVKPRR